jgi:hypothetical protein
MVLELSWFGEKLICIRDISLYYQITGDEKWIDRIRTEKRLKSMTRFEHEGKLIYVEYPETMTQFVVQVLQAYVDGKTERFIHDGN